MTAFRYLFHGIESHFDQAFAESRKGVPHAAPLEQVDQFRAIRGGQFTCFLNCADDAFINARRTLQERIAKFGPGSPAVLDWLTAQDRVFQNCAGDKPVIPDPAPSGSPPLLAADRTYQIAAAQFYAGNFNEAASMFRSIAVDAGSPWKSIAPYLVARSLIRRATLSAGPGKIDTDTLRQAETEFRRILSDSQQKSLHPAAEKMLGFVESRLSPEARLQGLASALLKPGSGAFAQNLTDYLFLFQKHATPGVRSQDDLTDWISSFRRQGDDVRDHAFSRWEVTGSTAWLVAALTKAKPTDSTTGQLLAGAARIPHASPAYPTVAFHRIRLLIATRQLQAARPELDSILSRPGSARNLFLATRMRLARTFGEFLRDAPRAPIGSETEGIEWRNPPATKPSPLFDADSAALFNGKLPLSLFLQAVTSKHLSPALRRDVALAGWVRAVLLDENAVAKSLVPAAMELAPELRSDLSDFLSANGSKEVAAFIILKHPGMRPWVTAGYPRGVRMASPGAIGSTLALDRIDEYRDNWWYSLATDSGEAKWWINHFRLRAEIPKPLQMLYPSGVSEWPDFLSAEQKSAAESEWKRLSSLPTAPNYLAMQVAGWARRAPGDPRIPAALHQAVRATRYGCTDDATGKYSREAFDLLHRNYANTDWAKRTPHWFK